MCGFGRPGLPRRWAVALAGLVLLVGGPADPPLQAGTELDHSAPPPGDAPPPAAVADPFAFDPVELWMSTYHLDPSPDRIPAMVGTLAARGAIGPESPRSREYLRFFAAALAAEPGAAAIKRSAEGAAGQEKALLLALAAKADHYAPAVPEAPADLPLLWAEYRATGDKARIAALAGLLVPADHAKGLADAAAASLLEQVPRHKGARISLNEVIREAPESVREKLAPLVARINERADLSTVLNQRGHNFEKAKQKEEALKAHRAAIDVYPTNTLPFADIADIHLDDEDKGAYAEALAGLQIAVAMEPDNAKHLAALGRAHFRLQRYQEADRWMSKARECSPKYAYAAHLQGRIALRMNDTPAAIRHFQAYLKLDPSGERLSGKERAVLAAAGIAAAKAPVATLAGLLMQGSYAALEGEIAALIRGKRKEPSGSSAVLAAYDGLTELPGPMESSAKWVRQHEDWAQRRPESAIAQAALGMVLVNHAWEARGSGWAASVLDERGTQFTERLLAAREHLEKAFQLDPDDPAAPVELMVVARGLGLGRDELDKQFQRAVAADATLVEPYVEKLTRLLPKWGGTTEETLAFARAAAAAAPADSPVPLVLFHAHRGIDDHRRNAGLDLGHFKSPEVWAELKPVFERHLLVYPAAVKTRNWYAWAAYQAGDAATALRELDALGEDWDARVWRSFIALKRARKELAAKK